MDQISLATPQDQPDLINLDNTTPAVSPDTAAARSMKIRFGLGSILGDQYHDTYSDLMSGKEPAIRQMASASLDAKAADYRQSQIQDLAMAGKLTPENIPQARQTDPNSVMEEAFAHTWMGSLQTASLNTGNDFLKENHPDVVQGLAGLGSEMISKHQMIVTEHQNNQDAINAEGLGTKALDYAKGFIPFYEEYKLRGNVPGVPWWSGGFLGENLENQATHLMNEPLDNFKQDFPKIMDYLRSADPNLAEQFLGILHGQTTQDKFTQDTFSAANLASFLPAESIGRALIGGTAVQAAKDVAEGAIKQEAFSRALPGYQSATLLHNPIENAIPMRAAAVEAAGDLKSAAAERVLNTVEEDLKGKANPTARMIETITDNMRLDKENIEKSPGYLSREETTRLLNQYDTFTGKFTDMVLNTMRSLRVPLDKATRATILAIQDNLKDKYPGLSNRIFNLTSPIYEPVSNSWHMGMDIGDTTGQLFQKEKQAVVAANMNDLKGYEIRQQGQGFYIRVYRPLDESTDVMRSFLVETGLSNNKSLKNAIWGFMRSPEDTMHKGEMISRKTAQYPQSKFREFARNEAQYVKDLVKGVVRQDPITGHDIPLWRRTARSWSKLWSTRQTWNEFTRVLDQSRNLGDVATGKMGYTFKNPNELKDFYLSTVGREPSYPEVEAYFAKSRLDLFDWATRNIRVYTNKARLGTETWRVFTGDEEGKPTYSNHFDGIAQKEMPGGNFGIALIDGPLGKEQKFGSAQEMAGKLGTDRWNEIKEGVQQGKYKVIELWAPEWRPLKDYGSIGNQRIRYVVTRNAENNPLSWNQVPRRGGGHFDYDYDHYIKQAIVKYSGDEPWYEGDTTIMPIAIRSMGHTIAKHLNVVREHLLNERDDLAEQYAKDNLPMPWSDLNKWFKSGRLSLKDEIKVVPRDQMISNMDDSIFRTHGKFRNGVKEGSKNSQYQVQYTGERDNEGLYTFNDTGTRNNPIYQWAPAQMVDPITTMNRGLNRIVNSTFMDDYKIAAIQKLMLEAEPYLIDSPEEKRSAPYWYFTRLDRMFRSGTDPVIKNNILGNWKKIQQFLGQPSKFDTMLHAAEQTLQDNMYDALGPKGAVVPTWLLHHVTDPIQYTRKMVYHAKLGLFNPGQWLLQNQAWTNIWSISPRSASAGGFGMLLHRWGTHNADDAVLNNLDSWATKLRIPGFHSWKPGEWKEAFKTLNMTNFAHVGGEYAALDTPNSYKFIGGRMSDFLDLSHVFFRDGVYTMRLGAWYAAFKEWRAAHPTGSISRSDIGEILNKADMYHANMSRASSSALNRGVLSLPMQFQTYFLGLTNLFLGKRLGANMAERSLARFRMAAFYSALYGVPAAIGLTGLPLREAWQRTAKSYGYTPGDNWWSTLANEGIPSMMTNISLGKIYNIGDRYGTPGIDPLKTALESDQPWWTVLGGASAETAFPFMSAQWAIVKGLTDPAYKLTVSDWLQPWKQITAVNKGWQLFMAVKFHEWLSQNEGLLQTNTTIPEAMTMAFTGLEPENVSTMFGSQETIKSYQAFGKYNMQQFLTHFRRAQRALKDNNEDLFKSEYKNASLFLSLLPQQQQQQAQSIAGRQSNTIPQAIDYNYMKLMSEMFPGWQGTYLQQYQKAQ